jgi:hypothetical protein
MNGVFLMFALFSEIAATTSLHLSQGGMSYLLRANELSHKKQASKIFRGL